MPKNNIDASLEQATDGLFYQSETDEPFEVVHWHNGHDALDTKKVLQLSGHKPGTPVQAVKLDDFFKELTQVQTWYDDQEKADVLKYRNLLQLFKQSLTNAQAFRVGESDVEIYIVGLTKDGDWAGLKTRAVET